MWYYTGVTDLRKSDRKPGRDHLPQRPREAEIHQLIAGDTALDFANTLNGHSRPNGHEYLHSYGDVALWCRHAGILTTEEARRVIDLEKRQPAKAEEAYRRSLALRETIFRVFHALALGAKPTDTDIERLSDAWRQAQAHAKITGSASGFRLGWGDEATFERMQRALTAAAVNTLISDRASRVKACAGEGCDWLFVDGSRNHLRRWCSMDECGNRAKMRRRQQRKKRARSAGRLRAGV